MAIQLDGTTEETKATKTTKPAAAKPKAPKLKPGQTMPDNNFGPGGRTKVKAVHGRGGDLVERDPKEGDEGRPRCLRCSDDKVAVLMGSTSTQGAVTYFACPLCGETGKKLADAVADAFRAGVRPRKTTPPIVQRPA